MSFSFERSIVLISVAVCGILGNSFYPTEERKLSPADLLSTSRAEENNLREIEYSDDVESCTLNLILNRIPETLCENVTRNKCEPELVLRHKRIRENCAERKEYCSTSYRLQTFYGDTTVCFRSKKLVCSNGTSSTFSASYLQEEIAKNFSDTPRTDPREGSICHANRVAVCTQTPQTVTITEKKKTCLRLRGPKSALVKDSKTEKFCITYENGTWACKSLNDEPRPGSSCLSTEEVKTVNSEIVEPKLDCVYKSLSPICHDSNCQLDNTAEPICQQVPGVPKSVKLRETLCEECKHGRLRIEPTLVEKKICRKKKETFCLETYHVDKKWQKICRKLQFPVNYTQGHYRVEIAPGRWINTESEEVAGAFREIQAATQEAYRKLIEPSITPTTTTDPIIRRFVECANNHKKCKFK